MLGNAPYVGFIPVTNLASANDFFVDTLGLTFVYEDEFALVVAANGTTIRITLVADQRPQSFTIAGWSSDDVAATVSQLKTDGVVFRRYDGLDQDELDIWHAPGGNLVAWFSDPDNNVLSISGRAPN
jgi:catechol 2,3-dioxygenase-like lactoylglutathione lyase family enzyme